MILVTSGYSICFVAQEMKTNKQKVGLKEKSALKCGFFLGRKSFPARFKKLLDITQKCKKRRRNKHCQNQKCKPPHKKRVCAPLPPGVNNSLPITTLAPPKKNTKQSAAEATASKQPRTKRRPDRDKQCAFIPSARATLPPPLPSATHSQSLSGTIHHSTNVEDKRLVEREWFKRWEALSESK